MPLATPLLLQPETKIKKIILAATIVGLSIGGALAQTAGPSAQGLMKTNIATGPLTTGRSRVTGSQLSGPIGMLV